MASPKRSFEVPYRDGVLDKSSLLTMKWQFYFRDLMAWVKPLGIEQFADIANNQASAVDLEGVRIDKRGSAVAHIDFLVQRVTDAPVELIEAGQLIAAYNPTSATWSLVEVNVDNPSDSGVTFSITATGQIQYTSSNISGTASLSRVVWRSRTMGAKSGLYSDIGARY